MNAKYIKSALAVCVFLIGTLAGKANAGLIIGDLYTDASGVAWEYVGFFDLAAGPSWNGDDFELYNGIEAAVEVFGALEQGDEYALSSAVFQDSEVYTVDHLAWYEGYRAPIEAKSESLVADINGNGSYEVGDFSAYISDRGVPEQHINHVFKTATVPEPSTQLMFSLVFIALVMRRFTYR